MACQHVLRPDITSSHYTGTPYSVIFWQIILFLLECTNRPTSRHWSDHIHKTVNKQTQTYIDAQHLSHIYTQFKIHDLRTYQLNYMVRIGRNHEEMLCYVADSNPDPRTNTFWETFCTSKFCLSQQLWQENIKSAVEMPLQNSKTKYPFEIFLRFIVRINAVII